MPNSEWRSDKKSRFGLSYQKHCGLAALGLAPITMPGRSGREESSEVLELTWNTSSCLTRSRSNATSFCGTSRYPNQGQKRERHREGGTLFLVKSVCSQLVSRTRFYRVQPGSNSFNGWTTNLEQFLSPLSFHRIALPQTFQLWIILNTPSSVQRTLTPIVLHWFKWTHYSRVSIRSNQLSILFTVSWTVQ